MRRLEYLGNVGNDAHLDLWDVSQCQPGTQIEEAAKRIQAVQRVFEAAENKVLATENKNLKEEFEKLKNEIYTQIIEKSPPKDSRWRCPWGTPAPLSVEWEKFIDQLVAFIRSNIGQVASLETYNAVLPKKVPKDIPEVISKPVSEPTSDVDSTDASIESDNSPSSGSNTVVGIIGLLIIVWVITKVVRKVFNMLS